MALRMANEKGAASQRRANRHEGVQQRHQDLQAELQQGREAMTRLKGERSARYAAEKAHKELLEQQKQLQA
eukprot:6173332-Pleurochrysis_carterae.AAC.2